MLKEPLTLLPLSGLASLAESEASGWLLEGIIPAAGTSLVVGRAFAGKTRFLCGLTMAMVTGQSLAGRAVKKGGVIWAYLEHSHRNLNADILEAAAGFGVDVSDDLPFRLLRLGTNKWTWDDDFQAPLMAMAAEFSPSLIIIDSLRRTGEHRESNSDDVGPLTDHLTALTAGNTRAVIGIHHVNARGGVRGSTDFQCGTGSTIFLEKRSEGAITVEAMHHGGAPVKWPLVIDTTDGILSYTPEHQKAATKRDAPPIDAMILAVLRSGPTTEPKIRDAVHKQNAVVRAALARLLSDDLVSLTGFNYRLKGVPA